MSETSTININSQADVTVVTGEGISDRQEEMNLDKISSSATNAINELPASPPPAQEGIRELLEQLERMVEADENLKPENKAEVLEQVKALAETAKNPVLEENKNIARSAIMRLRGIIEEAPKAVNFIEACQIVLPQIVTIFGVE